MDIGQTIFSGGISPSADNISRMESSGGAENARLKKVAKDFESVFLHRLLETMKDTIPDSEEESDDPSTEQIGGLYWSFLADAVAGSGGLGLGEQIYRQLLESVSQGKKGTALDESL